MSSRFFRISLVTILSIVLFYYSIAWAVLKCSHDQEDPDSEIALVNRHATPLNLECVGPDYYTESMAGSSPLSQFDRLMPEVTHHVNDFLTLQARSRGAASDLWLRAVFETSPSVAFLIGLPSYLFLSILRI